MTTTWDTNANRAYEQALACDQCVGAERWYERKYRFILRHRPANWSIEQACAVYACLSQNTSEAMNDRFYLQATRGEKIQHFGDCLRRVDLAIAGDVDAALAYKRGRKIASFYLNLRHPFTDDAVTIDRHMAVIITGDTTRRGWRLIERVGGYDKAAQAISSLAGALRRHEKQARLWVHHKLCP